MKCLVLGDSSYSELTESWGFETATDLSQDKVDLIFFTGGSDVDPSLYNHKRLPSCGPSNPPRDQQEVKVYELAKKYKVPTLGVCRGSQFLNVMNGGKLVQHMTGHTQNHTVTLYSGKEMEVTSSHHQMMIPAEGHRLLAWSKEKRSDTYFVGGSTPLPSKEIEVVYYPKTQSLCIQPHPEWMSEDSEFRKMCKRWTMAMVGKKS